MKRTIGLLAALSLTLGLAVIGGGPANAQTATPVVPIIQELELPPVVPAGNAVVYAVHGLNLDGQDSQDDGGTAVTVCALGAPLVDDFQFGDISEVVPVPVGLTVTIDVFAGAGTPCDTTDDPLISQDVTVPDVEAVAVVATAGPGGDLELAPFVLDTKAPEDCGLVNGPTPLQAPNGRIGAAHAAAAPPVTVDVDGDESPPIAFGEEDSLNLQAGVYGVTVLLDGDPIVGPVDIEIVPCVLTQIYVVGNQPLPEPTPTTPTTAAPTTATTAAAAPAGAAAATPRFTG